MGFGDPLAEQAGFAKARGCRNQGQRASHAGVQLRDELVEPPSYLSARRLLERAAALAAADS
jgi:hypothetical protein